MENYSFWADLMNSFRSSTDLVKIIWLLMPALTIASLVFAIVKLRRKPVFVFETPEMGRIEIYRVGNDSLLQALEKLDETAPKLMAPLMMSTEKSGK